jgi:hypothetical protein
MLPSWPSLRGCPYEICLPLDETMLWLLPSPRPLRDPSNGSSRQDPILLGYKTCLGYPKRTGCTRYRGGVESHTNAVTFTFSAAWHGNYITIIVPGLAENQRAGGRAAWMVDVRTWWSHDIMGEGITDVWRTIWLTSLQMSILVEALSGGPSM